MSSKTHKPVPVMYNGSSQPTLIQPNADGHYACVHCGKTYVRVADLRKHATKYTETKSTGTPGLQANPATSAGPSSLPPAPSPHPLPSPSPHLMSSPFAADQSAPPLPDHSPLPDLHNADLNDNYEVSIGSDQETDQPIPSSPPVHPHDHNNPSQNLPELVSDKVLEGNGFIINTRGRFLICLGCKQAVLPSIASGHGHNQHNMPKFKQKLLKRFIKQYSLFKNAIDFDNHLASLGQVIAFDGLDVKQGYGCTACVHAATTTQSLKTHWHTKHKDSGLPRPKPEICAAQHIFLCPQYNRNIPVQPKLNSEQAQHSFTAWMDACAALPTITPPPTAANEPPPWLKKLGWLKHVTSLNPTDMADLREKIRTDPMFKILSDAIVEYLRNAMAMLVLVQPSVRQILRSITGTIKPIMFSAPQSDDTIPQYANVISWIIIINYSLATTPDPPATPSLLQSQLDAITALYTSLEEGQPEDVTRNLLHEVLRLLLIYEFTDEQAEITSDPISMALIILNWHADGSFKKASEVSQSFAAVQFVARSTVLVHIYTVHKATNTSHHRQLKTLHPLMLQGSPTPLGNLYGYWVYVYRAALDEVGIPSFIFTSLDNMQFVYCGAPGTVHGLREIIHQSLDEADRILSEDILFGLEFPLLEKVGGTIYDDPTTLECGYSFLKDHRNGFEDGCHAFMKVVHESANPDIKDFFGVMVNGSWVWCAQRCLQWLKSCQRFLSRLLISSHFTHGQPTRGTELMSTTFANLPNYPRTIMFIANEAVNALAVNKTESISSHRKVSPHWMCPRGSRQLLVYLLLVRPVEIMIAKALLPLPVAQSYSFYLYTGLTGRWNSSVFSDKLYHITRDKFGPESGFTLAPVRQILIAIYHQFCNSLYAETESKTALEEFMEELGDRQANHGSRIAKSHYGIQPSEIGVIASSKMRALRLYSRGVHKFWQVASLEPGAIPSPTGSPPRSQNNLDTRAIRDAIRHEVNDLKADFMMSVEDMKRHLKDCLHLTVADTANAIVRSINHSPTTIPSYDNYPNATLLSMLNSFDPTISHFRSQEQAAALQAVVERKDHLLVVLPTGAGKTLLWMLPAKLLWKHQVVLVIIPYVSLRVDCERRCSGLGIPVSQWSAQPSPPQNGVVFVAVENAITQPFYQYASTLVALNKLALVVMDECHLVLTATTYREGFPSLQRLFGLGVPLLFLTATLPPHLIPLFKSTLNNSQLNIIRQPNHYKNIRICVEIAVDQRARISATVKKAKEWLGVLEGISGLGLVICRTVEETKEVAGLLGTRVFYGALSQSEKAEVFEEWRTGRQRIIVSTTACGTGVDLPNVRGVIHCGHPYDILTYVQNIGRLGRGGDLGVSYVIAEAGDRYESSRDDVEGVSFLRSMIVTPGQCRKLPVSAFVDGRAISCLDNNILCDACEKLVESSGGLYMGLKDLDGLISVALGKRPHEHDSELLSSRTRRRIDPTNDQHPHPVSNDADDYVHDSSSTIFESAPDTSTTIDPFMAPQVRSSTFAIPKVHDTTATPARSFKLPKIGSTYTGNPARTTGSRPRASSSRLDPGSGSSPSIALVMERGNAMRTLTSIQEMQKTVLAALEALRGVCVLCWVATDCEERGHVSYQCTSEGQGSAYGKGTLRMDVPANKPERVCYGCYVPTQTIGGGTHGNASKQNACYFAHILRPLVWACWHMQPVREELVERFGLGGIKSWDAFFQWSFKASTQNDKFMNLLFVLVWLIERSRSISI